MTIKEASLIELCANGKADIIDGPFGSNLKSEHFISEGIPTLKIQNVREFNILNKNLSYVSKSKFNELQRHSFVRGDIVLTKLGDPLGSAAIIENIEKGLIVADLVRIRINQEIIDTKYLCYLLNSADIKNKINSQSKGATRSRIKLSVIRDLRISYPSLPEQRRIVDKLDAMFAGLDQLSVGCQKIFHNISNLEEQCKLEFFRRLDAKYVELYKVAKIVNGFAFKSRDFLKNNGTAVIKITNVGIRKFIETEDVQLPLNFSKDYSSFKVDNGDIVFALTRTIINGGLKVAIVPKKYHGALLNQRVASVSPNKNLLNNEYLYSYLSSDIVKNYVLDNVNTLMQPNLSIDDLKNLKIPLIPIQEQENCLTRLQELEKNFNSLRVFNQRKDDELTALKKALVVKELKTQKI